MWVVETRLHVHHGTDPIVYIWKEILNYKYEQKIIFEHYRSDNSSDDIYSVFKQQ